ncbi:MAG: hypothetical protein JW809_09775 [Pirellulales bacterium]|nr:hypothetical protein [Pirellulales bacterium]
MPAQFDNLGISFLYPENWSLSEEVALAGCRSVTLSSPTGAFWTLSIHPRSANPAGLASAAVEAMRQEYDSLEAEEATETIAGQELTGFDLNFFFLDLTSTACVRTLRAERATYTIFFQAEDRDFAQLRDVFLAVTTSFLQNLRRLSYGEE